MQHRVVDKARGLGLEIRVLVERVIEELAVVEDGEGRVDVLEDLDLGFGVRGTVLVGEDFEREVAALGGDDVIVGDGKVVFFSEDGVEVEVE